MLIFSMEIQAMQPNHPPVISQYEKFGDYAKALELARKNNETPQTIERLEKSLLHLGSSRLLFDENHKPRAKLIELLEIVGMENPKEISQINDWAQKNLLRKGERWEEQTLQFEKLKSKISPLLTDLGFVNATTPHFTNYEGAMIHGAILSRVRLRLHYLIKQWELGTRFTHLYFLSGERPLDPMLENEKTLMSDEESLLKIRKDWIPPLEFPKTENEMIFLVWMQSDIPEDMRSQVEVHFINAPMKKEPKTEKLLRPTTDDTIKLWLKSSPPLGRYLAVTNYPYTARQDVVTRTFVSGEYGFETIGAADLDNQEKMAIYLDELARLIFQTKQFFAPPIITDITTSP